MGAEELYGTWRLVSNTREVLATGEIIDVFGKSPRGFLIYGRDGRMSVLVVGEKRPKPKDLGKVTDQERIELFKTCLAYGGTFTFDGKTVTHHIDISWNETWTGTDGVRDVRVEGNKLILTSRPGPDFLDGKVSKAVVTWERVK
jgi:hypothetical protein